MAKVRELPNQGLRISADRAISPSEKDIARELYRTARDMIYRYYDYEAPDNDAEKLRRREAAIAAMNTLILYYREIK